MASSTGTSLLGMKRVIDEAGVHVDSKVVLPVHLFGCVMDFCKVKERKNLSATCKELKGAYGSKAEGYALRALTKIVLQRKADWAMPIMDPTTTIGWGDCVPPIFMKNRRQASSYIYRQYEAVVSPYRSNDVVDGMTLDEAFEDDGFVRRILCLNELGSMFQLGDNVYDVFDNMFYQNSQFGSGLSFQQVRDTVRSEDGNLVDLMSEIETEVGILPMYTWTHE